MLFFMSRLHPSAISCSSLSACFDASWISHRDRSGKPVRDFHLAELIVEKHATESHKEGESAIKLDLPSFVVKTPFHRATPFHQATTERPAGVDLRREDRAGPAAAPPTALPSRSGPELSAECGTPLHAD